MPGLRPPRRAGGHRIREFPVTRVLLLAAVAVLIALAVLLTGPGDRTEMVAAVPVPLVAPKPPPNVERQWTPAAAQQQAVGDVTLHGVLLAGPGGAASQVLLKVDGWPEQLYRVGDQVIRGWSVDEIRQHEAVLRQGASRARLTMATAQADTGQSVLAGPSARAPSLSPPSAPAPGFIAGPPPQLTDEGASQRNRRFLEARQGRVQAR